MPTVITRTVKPAGGDFTSLRSALLNLSGQYGNLVALDSILRIECYAMEDTGRVDITDNWITDEHRYIHIVAPPGQRHGGTWTDEAYRLRVEDTYWAMSINTPGVRVEGLQVEPLTPGQVGILVLPSLAQPRVTVDGCIVRAAFSGPSWDHRGISSHANAGVIRVRNTLIYGFQNNFYWSGMQSGAELVFYGNTLYGAGDNNFAVAFWNVPVTLRLKNNLCVDRGTGADFAILYGDPAVADYAGNVSSDRSAPGQDAIREARVTFRDVQAEDFRLGCGDDVAQYGGADLSQDPVWPTTTDGAGARRTVPWSVGSLEYVPSRREAAHRIRLLAANIARHRPHPVHRDNGEEGDYPYVANYSKGLQHDSVGDVVPASYQSLLAALKSGDPADFEAILLGPGGKKLTNPQAGLAFDLQGPDPQAVTMKPAPRIASPQNSSEMGELYWMALLRDVPFVNWPTQVEESALQRALTSLNTEFPQFGGTTPVTVQNLFRGIYPGEQVGPYVSQFLWKGNADPRKPEGQGRDATDGYITYGSQVIDQRQWTAAQNQNYLRDFADWLAVQNGRDDRGGDQMDTGQRRFIRSLRDGTHHVHFAPAVSAFWNAAFLLLSEPTGTQGAGTGAGRPQVDREFPPNRGNPYGAAGSARQVGGATFGPAHLLQVLADAAGRAARAVAWQKWGVHRRMRPEEFGGRVHNHVTGARTYPIHSSLPSSMQSGGLSVYFTPATGYLLPQAYPEGAPTHPAYGAEHAAVAGACATVLKAFFDESTPIENPVQANFDGLALEPYTGADAGQMTVGGELNKLAGNIALFRNAAGVHWRSDYTESLPFGEAIAIGLLQEMSLGFNEDDAFFELTKFDGQKIRIFDGKVVPAA